jgi:crotonobetainyl-CoA:carnitine CoA-transferase CaiB-like acyl-CoA transferase
MSRRLMQVIHERGFCDASLAEKDFVNYQQLLMTFKEPITELFRAYAAIDAFFKTQTKAELFALAQERNLLIAPCSTLEDLVHSPQLDSRSYWVAVEHPELGRSFRYPGPFAKLSETPLTYRQRAPLLGEHNAEVFGSLGLTAGDLVALSGQAVL